MHEKIRDPMIVLFMGIDGRIENTIELIINDTNIPEKDIQNLIMDKEALLEIFEGKAGNSKEIHYKKIWSANNLINKIDYILEMNNKK
jgi:hypothetical protein